MVPPAIAAARQPRRDAPASPRAHLDKPRPRAAATQPQPIPCPSLAEAQHCAWSVGDGGVGAEAGGRHRRAAAAAAAGCVLVAAGEQLLPAAVAAAARAAVPGRTSLSRRRCVVRAGPGVEATRAGPRGCRTDRHCPRPPRPSSRSPVHPRVSVQPAARTTTRAENALSSHADSTRSPAVDGPSLSLTAPPPAAASEAPGRHG
jgi:hypothetical protein